MILVVRSLAVYAASAALLLWLAHRFVLPVPRRIAFLLAAAPLLFTGRADLRVDPRSPALVAASLSGWPGWGAEVDGSQTEVLPYNHAFLAVRVPAGRHHLALR